MKPAVEEGSLECTERTQLIANETISFLTEGLTTGNATDDEVTISKSHQQPNVSPALVTVAMGQQQLRAEVYILLASVFVHL